MQLFSRRGGEGSEVGVGSRARLESPLAESGSGTASQCCRKRYGMKTTFGSGKDLASWAKGSFRVSCRANPGHRDLPVRLKFLCFWACLVLAIVGR